ncbi:MAG: ribosome small subunit-dependent GTPase A [Caldilineales bacterium]|nr:ribosome small subunit-dependent GTPase A [Caldilineales bacterium]MCW5857898.1 ribosome small subunit-dependent GTPase A [Caldilineales bacterium]
MQGIVLRVYSDFFDLQAEDGSLWQCKVAGRLKRAERRSTLLAAGDRVAFQPHGEATRTGVIEQIEPRERVLSRLRPDSSHPYEDVILANPDELMIVFAAAQPEPHLRLLDRFLVAAEASELEAIFIAINKVDLVGAAAARDLFGLYENLYPVFYTSAETGLGIAELRNHLADRITVVAGPSGVGKSSLINAIEPGLNLRVGEVMHIGKGRHTTRAAQLHPLSAGGYIADTPGLRELGLWDVRPEELSDYFPEIHRHASACRFSFCTHLHEPDCAVRAAVEQGDISPARWDSYRRLFRGEDEG